LLTSNGAVFVVRICKSVVAVKRIAGITLGVRARCRLPCTTPTDLLNPLQFACNGSVTPWSPVHTLPTLTAGMGPRRLNGAVPANNVERRHICPRARRKQNGKASWPTAAGG